MALLSVNARVSKASKVLIKLTRHEMCPSVHFPGEIFCLVPCELNQAGCLGGSFLLRHIVALAGSRRLLVAHQFSKNCFDQWRGNPPYTRFIRHVSQIVLAAFVNADLTRATCHLRLDKELKGSFSACLFLIDIKNENKAGAFSLPY